MLTAGGGATQPLAERAGDVSNVKDVQGNALLFNKYMYKITQTWQLVSSDHKFCIFQCLLRAGNWNWATVRCPGFNFSSMLACIFLCRYWLFCVIAKIYIFVCFYITCLFARGSGLCNVCLLRPLQEDAGRKATAGMKYSSSQQKHVLQETPLLSEEANVVSLYKQVIGECCATGSPVWCHSFRETNLPCLNLAVVWEG